jgi:hypothetical protein
MVVSSSAFRFCGRDSRKMAMLPRCFAVSEDGNLGVDGFLDGFAMVRVMRGPIGPVKPN